MTFRHLIECGDCGGLYDGRQHARCPRPRCAPASPVQEVAAAIDAAEQSAGDLVEVPFSLTPPVSDRRAKQRGLF